MLFLVLFSRDFSNNNTTIKKRIHYKTYILSAIAFIGFFIITFNDFQEMRSITLSSDLLKGISLALASAFLMAYSVSLGRNTRLFIEEKYGASTTKISDINRAFIASAATKCFGMIGFLLTLPFLPSSSSTMLTMGTEAWFWVFFNGIVVVTLGSLTYREALARTNRPEIAIFWYLTPIFALIWLWAFNIESLSYSLLFGALLIISSNILLYIKKYSTNLNISLLSCFSFFLLFFTI
jgi:drug/metabolite transporter (DMT)-like permease